MHIHADKHNIQQSLLHSSVSHDPSEIINTLIWYSIIGTKFFIFMIIINVIFQDSLMNRKVNGQHSFEI